jgi:hypothetical protein
MHQHDTPEKENTMKLETKKERACAVIDPVAFFKEDWNGLPEVLRIGYARWWLFGIPAGSFLQAVIENNMFKGVTKADDGNLANLKPIVLWFYNNADSRAIGINAKAWGDAGGYFGRLIAAEEKAESNGA